MGEAEERCPALSADDRLRSADVRSPTPIPPDPDPAPTSAGLRLVTELAEPARDMRRVACGCGHRATSKAPCNACAALRMRRRVVSARIPIASSPASSSSARHSR
eukprot:2574177-Rhodomonas_salina.1